MNFSEPLAHSSLACLSPDSQHLALIKGLKLFLLPLPTLSPAQSYALADQTTGLEWSADSGYVLCVQGKRGVVQIYAREGGWNARISMGEAGVMKAGWMPDSRSIWTIGECQVRLTVWSLVNKSVSHIRNPKPTTTLRFSNDGRFLGLLERHSGKDYLGLYTTADLSLHLVTPT